MTDKDEEWERIEVDLRVDRRTAIRTSGALLAGLALLDRQASGAQVRALLTEGRVGGGGKPIVTEGEWAPRRREILAAMQRVMGPLPRRSRLTLDIDVEREEHAGGHLRRKLTYQSARGERVPAWLLIPDRLGEPAPAVLALHQTTEIGKDEAVGLGGLPNLHVGSELAARGYVVLAPDYPTLGEHKIDVYSRGWQSGSMKAIWDNMRGIDLLRSLPEVDGGRIGAIGHSLGGHNALFTAAFDERVRCAVTNCGFTSLARYYGGDLTGWWGPRYMPRVRTEFPTPDRMPFDFHDVLAAIAPRGIYVSAPIHDSNFDVAGVRDVVATVQPLYRRLHASGRLVAVYPDCAHEWPADGRAAAYAWVDRILAPKGRH
jgi:hypothetical protein